MSELVHSPAEAQALQNVALQVKSWIKACFPSLTWSAIETFSEVTGLPWLFLISSRVLTPASARMEFNNITTGLLGFFFFFLPWTHTHTHKNQSIKNKIIIIKNVTNFFAYCKPKYLLFNWYFMLKYSIIFIILIL